MAQRKSMIPGSMILGLSAASVLAAAALAHEYKAGSLEIGHPYAIETPARAVTGAGYFSVSNTGTTPDRLVGVTTAAPVEATLHETKIGSDGVAQMAPVAAIEIPAGASVALEPRGLHVMFTGLGGPLKAGDDLPAMLTFDHAGAVPVVFKVETRREATEPHGAHTGHGSHTGH